MKNLKTIALSVATLALFAFTTATISWKNDVHDFGDIKKANPVTHEFTFTNTTDKVVLINSVRPSCGCTVANHTKTPIKPNETGMVAATYNAAAPGAFHKTITVITSDSETPKVLTIKGKVIE